MCVLLCCLVFLFCLCGGVLVCRVLVCCLFDVLFFGLLCFCVLCCVLVYCCFVFCFSVWLFCVCVCVLDGGEEQLMEVDEEIEDDEDLKGFLDSEGDDGLSVGGEDVGELFDPGLCL